MIIEFGCEKQVKLNKTKLETGEILSIIKEQFDLAFQKKGVELIINKSTEDHWFVADQDKTIQILTNIVNNALQYTPSGKKVTVDIEDHKEYLRFIISDEGIGIDQQDHPYLFERFYRGDKSRDRRTGGIGIGLSIVKALVDAHQGEIIVESELDVGTTFSVTFPK
ncbi:signal transduction histidine kinase [Natronobacillus azotifigens]|uniref:histidine kinase n=1 Tax=Natronobacillus azotifigens TaxID=472978 RepID=A0A9J6RF28_9BACI|nr:ATP-binding protein [Natronobacillus azotifigens]MCZ0704167.1 ATP-binding protein [Natronobacillus azotifigens]